MSGRQIGEDEFVNSIVTLARQNLVRGPVGVTLGLTRAAIHVPVHADAPRLLLATAPANLRCEQSR